MDLSTLLLLGLGGYVLYRALSVPAAVAPVPTQTGGAEVPVLTPQPAAGQQSPITPVVSPGPTALETQIQQQAAAPMPVAEVQNPYPVGQATPTSPVVATISPDAWEQQRQGFLADAQSRLQTLYQYGLTDSQIENAISQFYDSALNNLPGKIVGVDAMAATLGWPVEQVYTLVAYVQDLHAAGMAYTGQIVY